MAVAVEPTANPGGLDLRPLTVGFGAEVHGVDLARDPDPQTLSALRGAMADYGVLFFRDQDLSPEAHLAFARRWGKINVNRFFRALDAHPEIAEVRKEPDQKINIGGGWHTDHSYDEVPAMGSVLVARELPAAGGDTLFADLAAAYDTLSDGLKSTLEGLRATHSSRHIFGAQSVTKADGASGDIGERIGNAEAATQDVVHPMVIRHPESGRRVLYVNPGFTIGIEGWTTAESSALLKFLYKHATVPERTLRFSWREGSVAFWDNRRTWHYALNDYHGERRHMHRLTIAGDVPA